MSKKVTLWSEFKRQGGWLLQACTTDVVKEIIGTNKKKKNYGNQNHYHVYTHYHFYGNKKPRR
jgi:hypothetical protein